MTEIFISRHLYNIRIKFIIICILNCLDYIMTNILLRTNLFYEGNIFMRNIMLDHYFGVFIKLFLPFALFTFVYLRMRRATVKQLKYSSNIINACLGFYVLIILSHCMWILLYLI